MNSIPSNNEREEWDAAIVRTHYSDPAGWLAILAALERGDTTDSLGNGEKLDWSYEIVEGPDWDGTSPDDVLAVAIQHQGLDVVFIADRITMIAPEHRFLAVSTANDETLEPEGYAAAVAYGREFRIRPGDMPSFHANLAIGNLGFEEYAEWARRDPEGVFRGFPD